MPPNVLEPMNREEPAVRSSSFPLFLPFTLLSDRNVKSLNFLSSVLPFLLENESPSKSGHEIQPSGSQGLVTVQGLFQHVRHHLCIKCTKTHICLNAVSCTMYC